MAEIGYLSISVTATTPGRRQIGQRCPPPDDGRWPHFRRVDPISATQVPKRYPIVIPPCPHMGRLFDHNGPPRAIQAPFEFMPLLPTKTDNQRSSTSCSLLLDRSCSITRYVRVRCTKPTRVPCWCSRGLGVGARHRGFLRTKSAAKCVFGVLVRWVPRIEKINPTPRGIFAQEYIFFCGKITPLAPYQVPLRTPRGVAFHLNVLGAPGGVHRGEEVSSDTGRNTASWAASYGRCRRLLFP